MQPMNGNTTDGRGHDADVIVVGGGLAGLTAANFLADHGVAVTLFEATSSFGGRANTDEREGHFLNRGPHAIYEDGPGMGVLAELDVYPTGGVVNTRGFVGISKGRTQLLPVGALSLLRTPLLTLRSRIEIGRLLGRISRVDPQSVASTSVADWIDSVAETAGANRLLRALTRLSTYSDDPDVLSAEVAITQLRLSNGSIRYLDQGWRSLVGLLERRARRSGARLVTDAPVRAMEVDGSGWIVRTDEAEFSAPQALLALAKPERAAHLSGSATLAAFAASAVASTVSCLEIGLKSLPVRGTPLALGIDEPTYVAVHSAFADLGPGAMIHAMRYGVERGDDTAEVRAGMEASLDLVQPGWRDVVDVARFLPIQHPCSSVATAAKGGFAGRPDVAVEDREGLYVAGDWVGPVGHLADASLSSGKRAAESIIAARAIPGSPRLYVGAGRRVE